MWLSEGPERNVNDFHRLTHNKFKKTYFKRNPKDPKELQVIRYFFNIFTGTPQPQISNLHAAEPDKDWVEMTQGNPPDEVQVADDQSVPLMEKAIADELKAEFISSDMRQRTRAMLWTHERRGVGGRTGNPELL